MYFWLALPYHGGFFLVIASEAYCLAVVLWLLAAQRFPCCRAQALRRMGFSHCGSWALEHRLSSCGTGV